MSEGQGGFQRKGPTCGFTPTQASGNSLIKLDENGFIPDWHEAAVSAASGYNPEYSENTDELLRLKHTMAGLIKKLAN